MLNEARVEDVMSSKFIEFIQKYKKLKRQNPELYRNLYVQFTNHFSQNIERTAYQNPDHQDPVGIYAYPIDYVINHPMDIWYGRTANYMRVLEKKGNNLVLNWIDRYDFDRLTYRLRDLGYTKERFSQSYLERLAKKYFPRALEGGKLLPKLWFALIQMDLNNPALKNPEDTNSEIEYKTRDGATQSAILKKLGYDSIEDKSGGKGTGIINQREPEQIVFLTRNSFEVLETIVLRGNFDGNLETLVIPDYDILNRKIAANIAAILNDKLSSRKDTGEGPTEFKKGYRTGQNFASVFFTIKGREIRITWFQIDIPETRNLGLGEKPKHKLWKTHDQYYAEVKIITEHGNIETRISNEESLNYLYDRIQNKWEEIKNTPPNPQYVPRNLNVLRSDDIKRSQEVYTKELIARHGQNANYFDNMVDFLNKMNQEFIKDGNAGAAIDNSDEYNLAIAYQLLEKFFNIAKISFGEEDFESQFKKALQYSVKLLQRWKAGDKDISNAKVFLSLFIKILKSLQVSGIDMKSLGVHLPKLFKNADEIIKQVKNKTTPNMSETYIITEEQLKNLQEDFPMDAHLYDRVRERVGQYTDERDKPVRFDIPENKIVKVVTSPFVRPRLSESLVREIIKRVNFLKNKVTIKLLPKGTNSFAIRLIDTGEERVFKDANFGNRSEGRYIYIIVRNNIGNTLMFGGKDKRPNVDNVISFEDMMLFFKKQGKKEVYDILPPMFDYST